MGSESEFDDRRDMKRKRHDKEKHDENLNKDNVCRDFLRNMCDRGKTCKFDHPSDRKRTFAFCHDFQHGYCRRNKNCRFIHASVEDESYYLKTGQLPPHLTSFQRTCSLNSEAEYCKSYLCKKCGEDNCGLRHANIEYRESECMLPSPLSGSVLHQQVLPYCKRFMWDNCWENNCGLNHITRSDFRKLEGRSPTPPDCRTNDNVFERTNVTEFDDGSKFRTDYYEPEMKRPYIVENDRIDAVGANGFENIPYQNGAQSEHNYIMLEEENQMLRKRITELKKRIDDLQVTNEFLLEQNARLRLQQDKNATGSLTAMTVPAVTITNSVPGATQIQQNPAPQQMVTAAVATVPVSISTVTPVSIAAVSVAPVQQLQSSVMTAQQGAPSGEPQITTQTLPMSISGPTVPLVSYPLMSRAVIQQPPNLR